MSNKYKTLLKETFIFALGSFGSKLISFFLVPLYTNVLSTSEYGIADLVMTCANLIVPVISLVIQDAILRFGLSKQYDRNSVFKCSILVFALGSIACILCAPFVKLYKPIAEWSLYLLVISITTMASNIMFSYAKAKGQNKAFALCSIIHTLILALTNILLLVVYPCGVKGYLIANIVAQIVSLIVLIVMTKAVGDFAKGHFDKALLKEMLLFSMPLIANNLSWWVLNSSDRVMIEMFCDNASLGLYTAASKIPALLSVVTTIFSQAWSVSAIKDYDSDRDRLFYSNVFAAYSILIFLGGSILIFAAKFIMSFYVGKEYYVSWNLVPLLIFGAVFYAFSAFFGSIYGALKKNSAVAITTTVAAVINILINFLFLETFGVIIAAISTAVSYFVIGVYRMIDTRKLLGLTIHYPKVAVNSAILLFQTILVSLDFCGEIVSIFAIVILVITNLNDIYNFVKMIKKKKVGKI